MVREPDAELVDAAREYVCVRVTDMSRVDLDVFAFDYDLTLAALVMHGDGTVYHRFGGRDAAEATMWSSLAGLAQLLRAAMPSHVEHCLAKITPPAHPPRYVVDLPPLARKRAANAKLRDACVHCHTVHDTLHAHAVETERLRPDDIWVYPSPARVGLTLDDIQQAKITAVAADTPAARAGLQAGDVLLSLGVQARVLTATDVQWALHRADPGAGDLAVAWRRGGAQHGGAQHEGTLPLLAGWKRATPEEYAWRPYKWNLSPTPGFGGPALTAADKKRLGLPADRFAFRVQYLVTWGEHSHRGRAAAKAGVREGDVILAFAGKSDFESVDHFHAWVPLTHRAGEVVAIEVLRGGERLTFELALPR